VYKNGLTLIAGNIFDDLASEENSIDTGHLYYSRMDSVEWLRDYADRLDYIHFKDINLDIHQEVMMLSRNYSWCRRGPLGRELRSICR
jgi:sugar phosphate isomerase/epimerase